LTKEPYDLLLTGGIVITVDDQRRVLEPGAVGVRGDRIVAVGSPEEFAGHSATRTVDCTGSALIPGFVDCHQHLFQYMLRGLGEGLELWPWLSEFMWPVIGAIQREDATIAAKLAGIEAARSGVTAVLDHHYAPTDFATTMGVADSIESVGLRGAVARGMGGDLTAVARENGLKDSLFVYSTDEEVELTEACIAARAGRRVGIWPAPVNVIYVSQDIVRRAVGIAREHGTGWHTHCSEASRDPDVYVEAYGERPVSWLHREGLLGPGTVIAHGIYLDDSEVEAVGETNSAVAYCPVSHEYIALGVMRLRELRRSGALIGLGCDGASGHRLDFFDCMKHGVLLQRIHHLDPVASTVEEGIELATREGARALMLDAGEIAVGKLADMAVVSFDAPHMRPLHRAVATLVHCADTADVTMTIVGGEVIYENGHVTRVDEADVVGEVCERAESLIRRGGLEELRIPWRHVVR
jgi:5-methylthioadenosine/S-adenosylhomocysteine deaminase